MKIKGLKELNKKLNDLQNNVNRISEQKSVSFGELFTKNFMENHTKEFTDINSFFEASPFILEK